MKKIFIALAYFFTIFIASPYAINANESNGAIALEPINIKATKIDVQDTDATYASEVYTHEQITKSGAKSLYDFLNQNTSTTVLPNFGNSFSQALDIRGFGLSQGFESIVITVNGRRLNNIDSAPQSLSSIPIQNIDRIEITKGSGSVVYGDGATAGTIQIYTRDETETSIAGSVGNFGRYGTTVNTGISTEKFKLSAFGDFYYQEGFSDRGPNGERDNGEKYSYKVKLRYLPSESSEFFVEKNATDLEYRYPNPLTLNTFESNPGSSSKTNVGPTNFTHQLEDIDNVGVGGIIKFGKHFETSLDYYNESKTTVFSTITFDYKTNAFLGDIKYLNGPLTIIAGGQSSDANRRCDDCFTPGTATKDNVGIFIQSYYDFESTTVSLGARKEWVDFSFNSRTDNDNFEAFDIGVNRAFGDHLSVFSNFNYAFQTPDVDFFFDFLGNFNGFIKPAKSKTINVGLNYLTPKNKTKLTIFGSKIKNEIFFNPVTFNNTNIDRSSKYGIELQNSYSFNDSVSAFINYAYIRAIIDHVDSNINCNNNCAGNELPGVSNHNITLGIHYKPTSKSSIILTQNYRSEAYSLNDFSNSASQKNKEFNRTDLSYLYTYKNDSGKKILGWLTQIDLSAKVENLFEQSNGLWLRDDVIYPTNFTRNFNFGAKFNF